jgi:putative FmdB family regulatory protein
MAVYDYQCAACGAEFEVELPMSIGAKPRVKCPACGSTRTAKLFGAAGVQFKGSGFYVTDSRTSDQKSTGGGKDITPAKPDSAKPESAKPDPAPAPEGKTPQPAAK